MSTTNRDNLLGTAFRHVPRTGVIFVMTEATAAGYNSLDPGWTNFGQGQPEVGDIPGAPARIQNLPIALEDNEYAPVSGLPELREAVADHYNRLYRRGMPSQYSAENVAISGGGRIALTRAAAALGRVNLGHFLPDYTAYEELLDLFRLFIPIPILLDPDRGYDFSLNELQREIQGRGLSALLLSNPCNPTGKAVRGHELAGWVELARRYDCSLLLDEFYAHYAWSAPDDEDPPAVTAARFVEDVDHDPVILFSGLTKNWRYPGWRICWTLGPKHVIDRISAAGSFLDGGASRPLQRATIPLLQPEHTRAEINALRQHFTAKRDLVLARLTSLGFHIERPPEGTFYVWASLKNLPPTLDTGMKLFRAGLQHQLICVPGEFFDVNPGGRRKSDLSRFHQHVRFSFGPPKDTLEAGLQRLETLVQSHK